MPDARAVPPRSGEQPLESPIPGSGSAAALVRIRGDDRWLSGTEKAVYGIIRHWRQPKAIRITGPGGDHQPVTVASGSRFAHNARLIES